MEEFIECLSHPEETLLPLLFPNQGLPGHVTALQLRLVCQSLFKEIERLATSHASLNGNPDSTGSLSGLEELYLGSDASHHVDAETLWGQVELQNDALHSLLRPAIKKLIRVVEKGDGCDIRLLEIGEVMSENESSQNEVDDTLDHEEDPEEETHRIRARMEKAMADLDDESSADQEEPMQNQPRPIESDQNSLEDPAAEELNDGFFNIHEMEAFADEEEDYLPDEAFGQANTVKADEEPKKSFHQRQREGDLSSGEDSDEEAARFRQGGNDIRRRKYREDDEVDVLYSLYDDEQNDDEDSAVNMTAQDLFGKPNKKYFETWQSKHNLKRATELEDDEFEDEGPGWRDEDGDNDKINEDDLIVDEQEDDGEAKQAGKLRPPEPSHSKQSDKLNFQTMQVEQELLAEKPWQMIGEAKGASRPVNSLLEAAPEFEVATKTAPLITVEHTASLEDVITNRIISEDWDNVVPRELPDVGWNKKRGELPEVSQEKSKLGLGELYEREYLKKAVGYDVDAAEKQTEEEKAQTEMKALFANLCSKLDALSNYHFAPRPVSDEAEVRPVTTPAIAMEEVMPLHVSDARGVAPEEVYGMKKRRDGVVRGGSELDQTERKRLRGAKKTARRKARKQKLVDEKLLSKLQPGLGLNNPYEKRKMREELSMARSSGKLSSGQRDTDVKYGASTTFFKRLQEETERSVRGSTEDTRKRKRADKASGGKSSAYKL